MKGVCVDIFDSNYLELGKLNFWMQFIRVRAFFTIS